MEHENQAAHPKSGDTAFIPWRCFHCDEVFMDAASARLHFGASERLQPACTIDIAEYRRMEEANRRHCEEDTDLHREIHRVTNEAAVAMRREEEKGYARGLADANAARHFLEELVLARFGVQSLAQLSERSFVAPGLTPRLSNAYNRGLAHLRGTLDAPLPVGSIQKA